MAELVAGYTGSVEAQLGVAVVTNRFTYHSLVWRRRWTTSTAWVPRLGRAKVGFFWWSSIRLGASGLTNLLSWTSIPHIRLLSSPVVLEGLLRFRAPYLGMDVFYLRVYWAAKCWSLFHSPATLLSFLHIGWYCLLSSASYQSSSNDSLTVALFWRQQFFIWRRVWPSLRCGFLVRVCSADRNVSYSSCQQGSPGQIQTRLPYGASRFLFGCNIFANHFFDGDC